MKYSSLQRQLIVRYGTTAFGTIAFVVLLGSLSALYARRIVSEETSEFLERQLSKSLLDSSKQTAEIYHRRFTTLRGTAAILTQIIQDRFLDDDSENNQQQQQRNDVFVDQWTRQPKYPFVIPNSSLSDFLPFFDWETMDWNDQSLSHELQQNPKDMEDNGKPRTNGNVSSSFSSSTFEFYSTKSAMWFVADDSYHHHDCHNNNNNNNNNEDEETCNYNSTTTTSSGPVMTSPPDLREKAAEISVFLKPLWESDPMILSISVMFFNDARGATMTFPSFPMSEKLKNSTYTSSGCDWLLTHVNPNTNKPYGTAEQIKQHCHSNGTKVPIRFFNPMEFEFCQDQIAHPGQSRIFGPYADALWPDQWRLTVGQAIYDRYTGDFLACTAIELDLDFLKSDFASSLYPQSNTLNTTDIAIVRQDGTVVAGAELTSHTDMKSHNNNESENLKTIHISDTDFILESTWNAVWDAFLEESDSNSANDGINYFSQEEEEVEDDVSGSVLRCNTKRRIYSLAPTKFNDFFVLISASIDDTYGTVVNEIVMDIDKEISRIIWTTVGIGLGGLIVFLLMVWLVAVVLTRPLVYLESVAWNIVNHNASSNNNNNNINSKTGAVRTTNGIPFTPSDEENITTAGSGTTTNADSFVTETGLIEEIDVKNNPLFKCTPKTEISELVAEFQVMIQGFSGTGASRVAQPALTELSNAVTWKDPMKDLYDLNPKVQERIHQEQAKSSQEFGKRLSFRYSTWNSMDESNDDDDASGMFRSVTLPNGSVDSASNRAGDSGSMLFNGNGGSITGKSSAHLTTFASSLQGSKPRINFGPNLSMDFVRSRRGRLMGTTSAATNGRREHQNYSDDGSDEEQKTYFDQDNFDRDKISILRSSLFRWILGYIAFPLLITIVVISAIVALELLNSFPKLFDKGSAVSFDLGVEGMQRTAALRAAQAEQLLPGSIRDLHMVTRFAGWFLFGALSMAESFTEAEIRWVEECKTFQDDVPCPYQTDITRSPCDCAWNDPWNRQCRNFPAGSRHLQRTFYMGQARDFDPVTGRRNASLSFPEYDYSPETTLWWTDIADMPGAPNGSNTSAYATTYDRARVGSALSVVIFPIYNYVVSDLLLTSHTSMSSFLAFEADGGFPGYAGCNEDFAKFSNFKSDDDNKAYIVNPDLCPIGKFGYDPRCRFWYSVTKQKGLESGKPLHVTAPFILATSWEVSDSGQAEQEPKKHQDVGTTASSPLIDPNTGEYVGAAAIILEVSKILPLDMTQETDDFFFVISPDPSFDADAVVGPDFPVGSSPKQIGEVVLPNDSTDSEFRKAFESITNDMKQGKVGKDKFMRTHEDGSGPKMQRISYAPVHSYAMKPVRPDDYTRGVEVSEELLYSIAIVRSEEFLRAPFEANKDYISEQLENVTIVYLVSVAAVTILCILITAKISVSVTQPMLILLQIVHRVNDRRIEDDLPPLAGGSREANQIYTSFAKLYKIVRMSNTSFFSGDFKLAHHIATDALHLFRKIDDKKAISIASNNVCNTLLALGMQRREKGHCMLVDGCCCVRMAIAYINEAIDSGNKEFDSGENDAVKAEFAQQLGDRHFNRAMCLLHSLDDPCCPQNARDIAYADLVRCRDYDTGVREFFMHEKLMFKYSDICFDRNIRRLYGLASLFSVDQTIWQIFDVNDLIDQTDTMLRAAWDQIEAPLFRTMSPVGRLQQLESAVVNLELVSDKVEEAARLAMRMLVEDEFLLDTSFAFAAASVLRHVSELPIDASPWPSDVITKTRHEFQKMRKSVKCASLDIGRCYVFCIEMTEKLQDMTTFRSVLSRECLSLYDEQCNDTDLVGLVALDSNVESNKMLPVGRRNQDGANQLEDAIRKATLELATSTSFPALPTAVHMATTAATAKAHDVLLIYITDGMIWDALTFQKLQVKIEKASRHHNGASIDIMIIGLGVSSSSSSEEEENNNNNNDEESSFINHCRKLCLATRSRHSHFFNVHAEREEELKETFETLNEMISSAKSKSSPDQDRLKLGLTMERF